MKRNLALLPLRLQSKLPLAFHKQYISNPTEHCALSQYLHRRTEEYHVNLNQNNQITCKDLNMQSPEYVAWELTIYLECLGVSV